MTKQNKPTSPVITPDMTQPVLTDKPGVVSQGINLDALPTIHHNWVQRGVVVSCEGANHPSHRHFMVRRTSG